MTLTRGNVPLLRLILLATPKQARSVEKSRTMPDFQLIKNDSKYHDFNVSPFMFSASPSCISVLVYCLSVESHQLVC